MPRTVGSPRRRAPERRSGRSSGRRSAARRRHAFRFPSRRRPRPIGFEVSGRLSGRSPAAASGRGRPGTSGRSPPARRGGTSSAAACRRREADEGSALAAHGDLSGRTTPGGPQDTPAGRRTGAPSGAGDGEVPLRDDAADLARLRAVARDQPDVVVALRLPGEVERNDAARGLQRAEAVRGPQRGVDAEEPLTLPGRRVERPYGVAGAGRRASGDRRGRRGDRCRDGGRGGTGRTGGTGGTGDRSDDRGLAEVDDVRADDESVDRAVPGGVASLRDLDGQDRGVRQLRLDLGERGYAPGYSRSRSLPRRSGSSASRSGSTRRSPGRPSGRPRAC